MAKRKLLGTVTGLVSIVAMLGAAGCNSSAQDSASQASTTSGATSQQSEMSQSASEPSNEGSSGNDSAPRHVEDHQLGEPAGQ